MDNIFSDLASLGLGGIGKTSIFEDEEKESAVKEEVKVETTVNEEDFIFDKTLTCPVCSKTFKTKQVKTGKPRFVGTDTDLRPRYEGIDTIKYDAAVCLHCGYGALVRNFTGVTVKQAKEVKTQISANFKGLVNEPGAYSYDAAIQRYKMALLTAMVIHSKTSERAYVCLKLAWMYRGMRESLDKDSADYAKIAKDCAINELSFTKNAYDGFTMALAKEMPPICGMDENTLNYMMSDLARRCQDYENAEKYAYAIVSSRTVQVKLKERARDQVALIRKEKGETEGAS